MGYCVVTYVNLRKDMQPFVCQDVHTFLKMLLYWWVRVFAPNVGASSPLGSKSPSRLCFKLII